MYLLLSGEGASDIGICNPTATQCDGDQFIAGPMSWMIDRLVELNQGYEFSHIKNARVSFVSESFLAENKPAANKKAMSLRGKKKPPETQYYFENARVLAIAVNGLFCTQIENSGAKNRRKSSCKLSN